MKVRKLVLLVFALLLLTSSTVAYANHELSGELCRPSDFATIPFSQTSCTCRFPASEIGYGWQGTDCKLDGESEWRICSRGPTATVWDCDDPLNSVGLFPAVQEYQKTPYGDNYIHHAYWGLYLRASDRGKTITLDHGDGRVGSWVMGSTEPLYQMITSHFYNDPYGQVEPKSYTQKLFVNGVEVARTRTDPPGTTAVFDLQNTSVLPGVYINDPSVSEAQRITGMQGATPIAPMRFDFTLTKSSSKPVEISYTIINGTARTPYDYYTTTRGVITLDPGERSRTLTVRVADDELDEPNETFKLVINSAVGARVNDTEGTATIVDDD